jgi:hypothetical protein
MKKILLVYLTILGSFVYGQEKEPFIDFKPIYRLGFHRPLAFGDNYFAKDLSPSFGLHSNFSLIQVYKVRLGFGYDFQSHNVKNPTSIGDFGSVNINQWYLMLEYSLPINKEWQINPNVSYGETKANYKGKGSGTLAKQTLEEIRLGGYATYYLNRSFSMYSGLHFSHFFNANLKANPENKNYFGSGNKIILSIGIEIH